MLQLDFFKSKVAILIEGALLGLIGPWFSNRVLDSFQQRATFPMELSRIEWVRHASVAMPCGIEALPFTSLVSEVVSWNERIAHEQEANRHWYSDPFTSDKWNAVKLIAIPCAERHG